MVAVRQRVELLEKNKPQQEQGQAHLRSVSSLRQRSYWLRLEWSGSQPIWWPKEHGITVPALYRYFPNKYAVLNALGAALMDKQNAVFQQWFDKYLGEGDPQLLLDNVYELLKATYDVTRSKSAVWKWCRHCGR